MQLARVAGTVVSSHKSETLEGIRFLVVEKLNAATMEGSGSFVVAMDGIGANVGEVVFFVTGSSARMTKTTDKKPADATIVAIVDTVEIGGEEVYRK